MPENGGIAGTFSHLPFQKGAMEAEVIFIIGVRAGKFLGVRRIFAQISPNLPKNFNVQFSLQIFFHKDHEDLLLMWPPKTGLHVFFCKPRVPVFEVKQRWAPLLPGFSGILLRFSANLNFWGCDCTPTSNTAAFHNSFMGNFMVYQDQLETNLLQLFGHPESSEWFSIISVIIFEVSVVDEQKQT